MPGETTSERQYCDSCHRAPPSWQRGRAVALYDGPIRRMALALKHGDRHDIAAPAADWMAVAGADVIEPECIVTAVPLHWRRLFRRRYNQAALLGEKLARARRLRFVPDVLKRIKPTVVQKGLTREERYKNQQDAICINNRTAECIARLPVLIVDDVMTTGATLSACAEACLDGGASSVNVIVMARVAFTE